MLLLNFLLWFLCGVGVSCSVVIAREDGLEIAEENPQPNSTMTLLGTIGNKTFYESVSVTHGVFVKSVCTKTGLQPGKIANSDELDFIQMQRPNTTGILLGGGIKSQENLFESKVAFEWADGSDLGDNINFFHTCDMWLCLYFRNHVIYPTLCLGEQEHTVLCEEIVTIPLHKLN